MTKIDKNVLMLIELLTKVTVRISSISEEGKTSRSSGFLYQKNENDIPFIITAGHKLPKKGSYIETRIIKDNEMLMINAGEFNVFFDRNNIDYAYSKLPTELYHKEIEKYKDVAFLSYQHKFSIAKKEEAYAFAVINNYEFIKDGDKYKIPEYLCFEVGLELVDQDENLNYFKPLEFKGHEYYEGASGAPITDPEGAITSILIGGNDRGILLATRLDNIKLE